jgi:diguanylate cyclase (GGDEF)-like protein
MTPNVRGKILVVDDSPIVTKIIQRALTQRGYAVETAKSGTEALQLFHEDNFSLVILDVNMPGMSGYEVAQHIRKTEEEIFLPIVFLSADTERSSRVQGLQQGGSVYLTKPFHEEEFVAQVESLLKIKELQDNLAQKNRLLEEMCRRDSLTSLYNHSYFQEIADHEFRRSQRYGNDVACVLMDIDDFKKINDTFGHPTGDRVLSELAELMLVSVRDVDIVARYGGEEFAVLLPMTNIRQAKLVCERARRAITERVFDAKKRGLKISVSMGVASLRAHTPASALQMIEMADQALYAAKNNGKNRSYIYVAEGENNDLAQAELERTLTLVS